MPFFDVWTKADAASGATYIMRPCTLQKVVDGSRAIAATFPYSFIAIYASVIAVVSLYEVFQHNNRTRQMIVGTVNSWLIMGLVVYVLYLTNSLNKTISPEVRGTYKLGYALPVVALVLNAIATRLIKRDERIVRSSDNIR